MSVTAAVVVRTQPSSGTPAAVIVIAVIAFVFVLAALTWGIARWMGIEPGWWQNVKRTLAEASWHAEAAWADFADWIRVGR
jgi:hypothetical protein